MNFADEIDRAAYITEKANDEAVEATRRLAAPEQVRNEDGSWPRTECTDCGEDIEAVRLELGRIRCFSCQDALEKRNRQFGRK